MTEMRCLMAFECCKKMRIALLLALSFFITVPAMAETIRIGGTGASRGILWVLRDVYARIHPEDTVFVAPPTGSTGGLKALDANMLDIAVISRELPKSFRKKGMRVHPVGKTPFIIITNNDVPSSSLNLSELANLYDGSQAFWPNGQRVRPILRPKMDSDNNILGSMSLQVKKALTKVMASDGMIFGYTDTMAADEVENIPGAFSTSTLTLVLSESRKVKVINLNGIAPTLEAVRNGRYPYTKKLYLVTRSAPPPSIVRFTNFILSNVGKNLLIKNGILPIK